MAKWWKYVTNPLGGIIQDLTKNAEPGGFFDAFSHIMNPIQSVGEGIADIFTRDSSSKVYRSAIEKMASKYGYSLEEFLKINPDAKKAYENADKNAFEKLKKFYDDNISDKVNSAIDNVTGERDVAENEKNRQFQHDEAEINRQWEEEQAQVAREWDSIGAQMERATAAGVNPISIAMQNGGINSSATTSIPSAPSTPSGSSGLMHNGILDIASAVFGGIGAVAENRLKQTQADDIVAMRKYNIAESIARTDHYRALCENVGLSSVAQAMQNEWIDLLNYGSYQASLGNSVESFASAKLKLNQIAEVQQNMEMAITRFNATLPLELQLSEAELNLRKLSAQEIIQNISMKHLQLIEQENRNRESSAVADTAETASQLAKATFEDAISTFHNDMVKGAAEAGISLQDYMYYNARPNNIWQVGGSLAGLFHDFYNSAKKGKKVLGDPANQVKGVELGK